MSNPACRGVAAALVACAAGTPALAAEPPFAILYHEKVALQRAAVGLDERVTFEAYGRQFELLLAPNDRMKRALPRATRDIEPLQGTVAGIPGSWVRLTRSASGWRGMFFDGEEVYAIEPEADVADAIAGSADEAGSNPVVYRLSDALLPLSDQFCDVAEASGEEEENTALDVYKAAVADVRLHAADYPSRQVRVSVVADYEFAQAFRFGISPEEAIVSRMNVVDGIFTSQLGMKVELATPTIFRDPNDPFTRFRARDLLEEVRRYRRNSPSELSSGLTHLMTGRNLFGETAGIAFMGSVCQGSTAASLSEGTRSITSASLIVAHEIAHNFNAPHDGEAGACWAVPQDFLMAPRLNGNDQFSACSIAQMQPLIASRSCVTAYTPPDVSIDVQDDEVPATVDVPFEISFLVRAAGDDSSNDVIASAALPAELTVLSAAATGASCTTGAGVVSCELGTLPGGAVRDVRLELVSSDAGSFTADITLTATDDRFEHNNSGTITIQVSGVAPALPPTQEPTATPGGRRGGGGRLDLFGATLLGLVLLGRTRRRTITHRS